MNLGTVDSHSQAVEKDEAWARQTSNLLIKLIAVLSKTIKTYRRFDAIDASLINRADGGLSSRTENTLHLIKLIVDDLDGFLEDFKDLKNLVEEFKSQIGLHVTVDGGRAISLQHWNVTIVG
ncbi:hypothetical protein CDEST_07070 [Colletotrichum destructivum]|uniref:Uncharacterized protein n=1 Tax=Colletotrichum destructivum TaxID=34406 RepID=A0AAX4IFB6_9PEZI|nr:hypothetical protein CDEST_07070 [Colletotrichum destructivum]